MLPRVRASASGRSRLLGALAGLLAVGLIASGCGSSNQDDSATQQAMTNTDTVMSGRTYVAMGDSYTAAPLWPLRQSPKGCLRSGDNYPAIVARTLNLSMTDVSCSGASTTSMWYPQHFADHSKLPAQLDALSDKTDLVTIGVGANDYQYFTRMMTDCLAIAKKDPRGAPCRAHNDDAAGTDRLERKLGDIEQHIARTVRGIHHRAPNARILVIGYPQLIPDSGECRRRLPLAVGDYRYTKNLNKSLARRVEAGAVKAGADYVDVAAASQGHDICSKSPWIAGIRGDGGRAMGLHPYPAEQRAVAAMVLKLL